MKKIDPNRVLWENAVCFVYNKLPGEITGDEEDFPRAVHRLDVPVSGCTLFAREPGALAFLSGLFREASAGDDARRLYKRYWAVTELPGKAVPEAGELVHRLVRQGGANKFFALDMAENRGREGRLRYRIIGRGEHYLFLEIELLTGRSHQIRAQLARLGLHIKGDLKYGARRSEKAGGIRLHAWELRFPNPLAPEEMIRAVAPPPLRDSLWAAFEEAVNMKEREHEVP